jgi:hypothetical protein
VKTKPVAKEPAWDVCFWFAVSSPFLGVLLGILAGMNEEVMSIISIIFVLVILLFDFDSAGQVKTR